jgi:hypothetical protein
VKFESCYSTSPVMPGTADAHCTRAELAAAGLGIGVLPPSLGMSWIDQRYLSSSAIVFRSFIRSRFPEREGVSSAKRCPCKRSDAVEEPLGEKIEQNILAQVGAQSCQRDGDSNDRRFVDSCVRNRHDTGSQRRIRYSGHIKCRHTTNLSQYT